MTGPDSGTKVVQSVVGGAPTLPGKFPVFDAIVLFSTCPAADMKPKGLKDRVIGGVTDVGNQYACHIATLTVELIVTNACNAVWILADEFFDEVAFARST